MTPAPCAPALAYLPPPPKRLRPPAFTREQAFAFYELVRAGYLPGAARRLVLAAGTLLPPAPRGAA